MGIFVFSSKYEELEKETVALRQQNKMQSNKIDALQKNIGFLTTKNKSLELELKTKTYKLADIANKNRIEISRLKTELAKNEEVFHQNFQKMHDFYNKELNEEIKQKSYRELNLMNEIAILRKVSINGYSTLSSKELRFVFDNIIQQKENEEIEFSKKTKLISVIINLLNYKLYLIEKDTIKLLSLLELTIEDNNEAVNEIKQLIQNTIFNLFKIDAGE